MSESNEVVLPPYPADNVTVAGLYRYLRGLREWIIEQQGIMYSLLTQEQRDTVINLPDLSSTEVWANVSVVDHHHVLQCLQGIRAGWDAVLREHEDCWDSKLAVIRRHGLLAFAIKVLDEAFTGPEEREMKTQQEQQKMLLSLKRLEKHFTEIISEFGEEDD